MSKEIVYTPAPCKGDKAEFSGQVILNVPSYEERMEIMLEADMLSVSQDEAGVDKAKSLKMMMEMVKASYRFYKKVDITHKPSKTKFDSLDDLRYSPKGAAILNDVATYLLNADGLGKA